MYGVIDSKCFEILRLESNWHSIEPLNGLPVKLHICYFEFLVLYRELFKKTKSKCSVSLATVVLYDGFLKAKSYTIFCFLPCLIFFQRVLWVSGMGKSKLKLFYFDYKDQPTQPAFTCSKLTIGTLRQGVTYVLSY